MIGIFIKRHMKADDIRFSINFFKFHFLYTMIAETFFKFIISQDFTVETHEFFGKGGTGISIADDANCFSFYFNSFILFAMPFMLLNFFKRTGNMVEQSKQKPKRMFAHGVFICLR